MKRNKKWLTLGALTLGMLVVSGQVNAEDVTEGDAPAPKTVKIAYTNDIHGYIDFAHDKDKATSVGLANYAAIAKTNGVDFKFDAGDTFHGSPLSVLTDGQVVAEAMNAAHIDAMTIGNHDWNYGVGELNGLLGEFGGFALCANIHELNNANQLTNLKPYHIFERSDGVRIGVFGVIDQNVYNSTNPALLENKVEYLNAVDIAKQTINTMKTEALAPDNEGKATKAPLDLVVALTHTTDIQKLAKDVPGIDLEITGHEHNEYAKKAESSDTFIVQSGSHLTNYNEVDVTITKDGNTTKKEFKNTVIKPESLVVKTIKGTEETPDTYTTEGFKQGETDEIIFNDDAKSQQTAVQSVIDVEKANLDPTMKAIVGYTQKDLKADKKTVRSGDTPLSRMMTDSFISGTDADFSLENGGGIRGNDIPAGKITYEQLAGLSPFGNTVMVKEMTGAQLKEILEISLDKILEYHANSEAKDSGDGLMVGGLIYHYDAAKPKGERIWKMVTTNGEDKGADIDLAKSYKVALSSYINTCKLYPSIKDMKLVHEYDTELEMIQDYLGKTMNDDKAQLETNEVESLSFQGPDRMVAGETPAPAPESTTTSTESSSTSTITSSSLPATDGEEEDEDVVGTEKEDADRELPNTGEKIAKGAAIVGGILVVAAAAFYFVSKRKSANK